jgi:hypothetical protein
VAALVGQQRELDAVSLGERAEDVDRVVADAEQRDAVRLQDGVDALQLDELRLAERSPISAAVDDDEGLATRARLVEVDHRARLIRQAHVGKRLALLGPDRPKISGWKRHRCPLLGREWDGPA